MRVVEVSVRVPLEVCLDARFVFSRPGASLQADFGRFRGDGAPKGDQESYKWDRVANYQENWDIDADDFSSHAIAALKPAAQGMGQLPNNGACPSCMGAKVGRRGT